MPRKSKNESTSWDDFGQEMARKFTDKKMWMHGPWMMGMGGCCCHKGRGLGAFILAVSVIWTLNIMSIIPPTVPIWLEFLVALGFAATFN